MRTLQSFSQEILERQGALTERMDPDGLELVAPDPLCQLLNWPSSSLRLGFGATLPAGALRVGLEGDWLQRLGGVLGERGRWLRLRLGDPRPPTDPHRLLAQALSLPNAIARLRGSSTQWTRCWAVCARFGAVSDEKNEGLLWLAFNCGTRTLVPDYFAKVEPTLPPEDEATSPSEQELAAAGAVPPEALVRGRLEPALQIMLRHRLEPFLRAMGNRMERDRQRVHNYHQELCAAAALRSGEPAHAEARQQMRRQAIEREYAAKIEDLRRQYAVRVSVEIVQVVEVIEPVQRLEIQIARRKGLRTVFLDWHPLPRCLDLPPCDWGPGLDRVRLVCDERLHLTDASLDLDCPDCARPWCRACHPKACPRCPAPPPAL